MIVSTVHRLPRRRSDPYDAVYSLPERLRAAGVEFCIAAKSTSNARNLPYEAAMAVGFGLPPDEALKAITLYPARILGVDERVGSLEVGKDATLIVTDGDPLETPTQVEAAFIQGRRLDLSDRHKRLWQKYREKYRRLEAAGRNR
ncbi:MAG: amidohydrolase family protein [Planctomycetota bacterium]